MATFITLCLGLLFSLPAFGQNYVVIADLDETVRMANVENKPAAGFRLMKGVRPYQGMRLVLQKLAQRDDVVFVYLSNSFNFLYDAKKWLRKHHLPAGSVYQRMIGDKKKTFKPRILKRLYERYGSSPQYYLFGDNIEDDVRFYRDFLWQKPVFGLAIIRDAKLEFPAGDGQITYFQHEKQLIQEFELSPELFQKISSTQLVPTYLKRNLRKRLYRVCRKNQVMSVCQRYSKKLAQDLWQRALVPNHTKRGIASRIFL